MAFCGACGSQLHVDSKYCHNCGQKTSQTPTSDRPARGTISFEEFKKRKEVARQTHFTKPGKKGNLIKPKKEPVKVQVGLVNLDQSSNCLKKVKGRTIPVLLPTDSDATSLRSAAVDKHARHFKQFNSCLDYVLLYPDMSQVHFLPGGTAPFTLEKYKEDLLKPYSKIYFWLCETSDFEKCQDSSGDDSEFEKPTVCTKVSPSSGSGQTSGGGPSTSASAQTSDGISPSASAQTSGAMPSPLSSHTSAATSSHILTLPSTSSGKHSENTRYADTGVSDANHQCPTCLLHFPLSDIEEHADSCAEGWIDPIGDCIIVVDEEEHQEENTDNNKDGGDMGSEGNIGCEGDADNIGPEEKLEAIKVAVSHIQQIYITTHYNRINIRRSSAFKDFSVARRKKWYKKKGLLKVTFLGEPAVDDGGPKREFFSEVFGYIKSTFFDQEGMPYADMRALANEDFKVVGELLALSIIQGGPAPCMLSIPVFNYIVNGMSSVDAQVWLSQVTDDSLKQHIEELTSCKSDEDVRQLLSKESMLDALQLTGYRGVPSRETLDSTRDITRSLVISGIAKTLAVIDQLIVGLQTFSFLLEYVKTHQSLMQPVFTVEGNTTFKPTSDILLNALKPEYSENGSNLKAEEINIYKFFCDYLQDLEITEGGLSTLYKFITGSSSFTPLALEKTIIVRFKYGCPPDCRCRPTASTCEPCINLPMHYKEVKQFEDCMNSALVEGVGFGLI